MANILVQDLKDLFNILQNGRKPARLTSGVVIEGGSNPVIGLDPFVPLPRQAVIIPEHFKDSSITITDEDGNETVIPQNNGLRTGEKVTLFQDEGQQTFLVVARSGG